MTTPAGAHKKQAEALLIDRAPLKRQCRVCRRMTSTFSAVELAIEAWPNPGRWGYLDAHRPVCAIHQKQAWSDE